MGQDLRKLVGKLNDLIALDIDAIEAYEAAIKRVSFSGLQERLLSFQQDHERHVAELSDCVTRYGETPRERPDMKGFFLKAFTAVTAMMGDEAALRAMAGNERLTNRTYELALEEHWPEEIRRIIERNYADEQRHLAFIHDALSNRVWDMAEQARP
jgi:uncharacterized protein (TIGR02284 family)